MDPLGLFDRLIAQLHRYQFRVPEWVFWVVGLAAAAGIFVSLQACSAATALCAGAILLVAAIGVGRWRHHRRRSRGGLVVCLFASPGAEDRQESVQRAIISSLQDKLTTEEAALVHKLPVA